MSLVRNPKLTLLVLISCIGLVVFVSLGCWQLSRSIEKRHLLADYAARQQQPPIAVSATQVLDQQSLYSPVKLSGRWRTEESILLDNQHWQKQTGVIVLTPFELSAGAIVLVNRGFVALTQDRRLSETDQQAILALPSQAKTEVTGLLWTWPQASLQLAPVASELSGLTLWSNVDPFVLASSWTGQPLWQTAVIMLSEGEAYGFPRRFEPINTNFGPEKHVAYAIQWFSFAVIIVILWLAFFWRCRSQNI